MAWLIRTLRVPANTPTINVVLGLCALCMAVMSIAIVWQAQIIANQRENIQWLEKLKMGM